MTVISWIDLNFYEIKNSLLYGKYFDSIGLESLIDEYSVFNPQLGIDLILREDLSVKAVYFYSGKSEGAKQFTGELPFSLEFANSRDFAREILGPPQASGVGDTSILYGKAPFWDRYAFDNFILHLQFKEELKNIDLITVYSSREII